MVTTLRKDINNIYFASFLVMPSQLVTLDVSGRKYTTQKATLQSAPYFQNLMARWDNCTDKQEDGSYFVDADPDTFQHILDFMRRPSKFPLFWTRETGYDYVLYNKLEAEADYFLMHDLRDWICGKRYADAVTTVVEVKTLPQNQTHPHWQKTINETDVQFQAYYGTYSGQKSLRSPSSSVHDRLAHRGGSCAHLEQTTLVIKSTRFDQKVCVNNTVS